MSDDPEFVQRINNQLATIAENQARFDERQAAFDRNMTLMQEAIAGLIKVARIQDERMDRAERRVEETSKLTQDNAEHIKELGERVDALIRIVEGRVSNHPQ